MPANSTWVSLVRAPEVKLPVKGATSSVTLASTAVGALWSKV